MRRTSRLLGCLVALGIAGAAFAAEAPPPWAYGFKDPLPSGYQPPPGPPAAPPATPDPALRSLPGAKKQFTRTEIGNPFGPADWYPEDHPAMPEVVARGKRPDVMACALCHYPNGKGRPENAAIVGLPTPYFIEQMNHFRNDQRKTTDPRKTNTHLMTVIAKGMTDEEIKVAAEYFGSMKFTPWIKVVETERVPKTTTSLGLFLPVAGNESEPIGDRIIEVPEDVEAVEVLRSPRVGFIAYAPPGSIKKGEALVTTGGGKSPLPCGACHGADLKGMLNIPAIAGRSPSYMVRQMLDMKSGTRTGPGVDLMKPIVANFTAEDMLAIAAYTASLQP